MSDIPQARDIVCQVAADLRCIGQDKHADTLIEALDLMVRRPLARPRAPRQAPPLTPEMADFLRRYAAANPTVLQREIGYRFGIDGGRVSEALHGDR